MKKIILLFVVAVFLVSCSSNELKVIVGNPSDFDRQSDMIEIPVEEVKKKVTLTDAQVYQVKNDLGEVVASQVTSDGKLIFQSNLKAKGVGTFTITAGQHQVFDAKTYARFISERKDDFAWENDRVAFRAYGPALVAVDGPSNGFDIWYKRTNNLVINKWYKDDLAGISSYHNDNGEGLDDYKVGRTLGAGAMAPYIDEKLVLNGNYVSQELIDNGPLRTTFKLTYDDIEIGSNKYPEVRTITIDAGSQLSKVQQSYAGLKESIKVAGGIAKRTNDSIVVSTENNFIVYAEPTTEKAGSVFVGLFFLEGMESSAVDTYTMTHAINDKEQTHSHVLGITTYKPDTPVTYYTGYGWSRSGFETITQFQTYMEHFAKGLKEPLVVKY